MESDSVIGHTTTRKSLRFIQRPRFDFWLLVLIVSSIFLIIGAYMVLSTDSQKWQWFVVIGQVGVVAFWAERIWYNFTFKFNAKTGVLIPNRWKEYYQFRFRDVKRAELYDGKLMLTYRKENRQTIDVTNVRDEDLEKLLKLIKSRIG